MPMQPALTEEQRDAIKPLFEVYAPEGVLIWLFAPHHSLGLASPAQAIIDGRGDDVAMLVDQLASGAFI